MNLRNIPGYAIAIISNFKDAILSGKLNRMNGAHRFSGVPAYFAAICFHNKGETFEIVT